MYSFAFTSLLYLILLLIGGIWVYLNQSDITNAAAVVSLFPMEAIADGLGDIYNTNIKPLFLPEEPFWSWSSFFSNLKPICLVSFFKFSVSATHTFGNWFPLIKSFDTSDGVFYYIFNVLTVAGVLYKRFVLEDTYALLVSIIKIPFSVFNFGPSPGWFKGFEVVSQILKNRWVEDVVWALASYYTTFEYCYLRYLWGVKDIVKGDYVLTTVVYHNYLDANIPFLKPANLLDLADLPYKDVDYVEETVDKDGIKTTNKYTKQVLNLEALEAETPGIKEHLNKEGRVNINRAKNAVNLDPEINARLCQIALHEGVVTPFYEEGISKKFVPKDAEILTEETLPIIEHIDIPEDSTIKRAIAYNKYLTLCLSVTTGCVITYAIRFIAHQSVNAAVTVLS